MGRIAQALIVLAVLAVLVGMGVSYTAIQNLSLSVEGEVRDIINQVVMRQRYMAVTKPKNNQVEQATINTDVDYEIIREIVDSTMQEYSEKPYLACNQNHVESNIEYDPVVVNAMKHQANVTLDAAIEAGIWTLESADAFYEAVEQLPEDDRFEFYVKHSASLNRGELMFPAEVDPSLLLR